MFILTHEYVPKDDLDGTWATRPQRLVRAGVRIMLTLGFLGGKKELLSVRIPAGLKARLDRASDQERDPYAPTRARVIERGIELALRELEAKKAKTRR